jgi:hypothetical protein
LSLKPLQSKPVIAWTCAVNEPWGVSGFRISQIRRSE